VSVESVATDGNCQVIALKLQLPCVCVCVYVCACVCLYIYVYINSVGTAERAFISLNCECCIGK
jgi:hypothetical protein